jgi:DNA-binding transcriptional regulator YiaG
MTVGSDREERAVAGHTFVADLPAYVCKSCGESVIDYATLHRFNLAIAGRIAELGASSGEAFKFMRKAIGMKAVDLATLLNVAPETISRWETGQRSVDRGALIVLGAIVLDQLGNRTTTIERLHALQEPVKASGEVVVRIDDWAA